MTDIGRWAELVHCASILHRTIGEQVVMRDGDPVFANYVMVPLTAYQMGNLLDALTQAYENGDWYGEFCDIIAVAMEKAGIKELTSNSGKKFLYEDVKMRRLK